MKRIICFDTETTGFEYTRGDKIIEIGAVEIIDGKITGKTFHEFINPDGKIIPNEVYLIHKISNEFLKDKPKMKEVANRFLEFVGDSPIVAHNGFDFDFPFLNYELAALKLPIIQKEQQMDSLVIARNRVFGPKMYTLDALAKWFGISLSARADSHGALIDSEILARLYLELDNSVAARDIADVIAEQHLNMQNHPKIGADFKRRFFKVSDEEMKIHNKFIEQICV